MKVLGAFALGFVLFVLLCRFFPIADQNRPQSNPMPAPVVMRDIRPLAIGDVVEFHSYEEFPIWVVLDLDSWRAVELARKHYEANYKADPVEAAEHRDFLVKREKLRLFPLGTQAKVLNIGEDQIEIEVITPDQPHPKGWIRREDFRRNDPN